MDNTPKSKRKTTRTKRRKFNQKLKKILSDAMPGELTGDDLKTILQGAALAGHLFRIAQTEGSHPSAPMPIISARRAILEL